MLSVSIDSDDALRIGDVFKHIGKGCFQRPSFPFIDAMVQHCALWVFLCHSKPLLMFRIAPVIYDHDVAETTFNQPGDHSAELCVRIERREHNREGIAAISDELIHTR